MTFNTVIADKYYAIPRGGQIPLFDEDIPVYLETTTSETVLSQPTSGISLEEEQRQKKAEDKYNAEVKERLNFYMAFDKGIMWACDQIQNILTGDRAARIAHGWPLDYETLRSNVGVFIAGQKNRMEV
jgi:hypothetical protein